MIRTSPPPCINVARAKSSTYLLHFNNAMYIEKGCVRKYEVSALNMKNYNINSISVPSKKRSTQISAPSYKRSTRIRIRGYSIIMSLKK